MPLILVGFIREREERCDEFTGERERGEMLLIFVGFTRERGEMYGFMGKREGSDVMDSWGERRDALDHC